MHIVEEATVACDSCTNMLRVYFVKELAHGPVGIAGILVRDLDDLDKEPAHAWKVFGTVATNGTSGPTYSQRTACGPCWDALVASAAKSGCRLPVHAKLLRKHYRTSATSETTP